MMLTATKITSQKFRPRVINYSDYKYFRNENYRKYLLTKKYLTLVLDLMIVVSVNFLIYVE